MPLVVGKRVGRVDLPDRSPEFNRRAVDEAEFNRIILAEQTGARGLRAGGPNPPGHREGGTVVQQSARSADEIIHAVKLRRRVVRLETAELRRTRPGRRD